jgi:hypothetical protein
MGYFFNVVLEDHDNLNDDYYINNNKLNSDQKLNLIQSAIGESEKIKFREFNIDDLYTLRSEVSYYIF